MPVPLAILGVCILAYGLLTPKLGFYMDDWYIVLYQKIFGAGDYSRFFANDRPLFAYVYNVFVPIFKDSQLGWQLFAVFSHALAGVVFWRLLTMLFPTQKRFTAIASLLLVVYPGFKFHWFAVMYSQIFMLLAVYFLSYILMIYAVKRPRGRILYTLGALACVVIGIVPQETFFGLELVRPIILWVLLADPQIPAKKRFRIASKLWLPYLAILMAFVILRVRFSQAYSCWIISKQPR
jgi:hypothetical protein